MHAPLAARLYLVRHGRTALNADGRLRGRLDPPLDEVGREQVSAVAGALSPFGPVRVVSSPLRRAVQTAEAIAVRAGLSVLTDDRLADRDYGPWAGSTEREVVAKFGSLDEAPGVEPAESVVGRARAALDASLPFLDDGPVVIVAHDAVNRLLLSSLYADPHPDAQIVQPMACWNVLARADNRWLVERIAEVAG